MSKSLKWYELSGELAKAMKQFYLKHGERAVQANPTKTKQ